MAKLFVLQKLILVVWELLVRQIVMIGSLVHWHTLNDILFFIMVRI